MPAQRLLDERALAHYLGDIPVAEAARTAVGRVRWGRSWRWDIRAIDAHLDALMKVAPESVPAANDAKPAPPTAPIDDDPEAAFDRSAKFA